MITWQVRGHSLRDASVSQSSKPNPQSLSFPILKILNTYLMGLFYEPVQIDEIMYVDKLHKIYMKI